MLHPTPVTTYGNYLRFIFGQNMVRMDAVVPDTARMLASQAEAIVDC